MEGGGGVGSPFSKVGQSNTGSASILADLHYWNKNKLKNKTMTTSDDSC